jgi:GT2 family glycosyltransferase
MISIIIVHYKADIVFFDCLRSLEKNKPKGKYEVIVVDNDERARIDKKIKKEFPHVIYIKSPRNVGFGAGNNLGAKHANGEYLFFLNPDTTIFTNTIDTLVKFLETHKKAGIVAPLLLDPQTKPYDLQGTSLLTPFRALFSLSFINKLFPNNLIAKSYWNTGWDKTKVKEVDVVPGTAFMIRKEIFNKIHGFDEHFFLYFEEFDLCKRIREKGYGIFITPSARLIHLWGKGGTGEAKNIGTVFKQSRFYYFKKHYGFTTALFTGLFLNIGKTTFLMTGILFLSAFLLFYHINTLMPFIGDQAWFYLSARDIFLRKSLPLVGITASHPWLHQGSYWTYMLAFMLWLFHFNPVSGAYLSAVLTILSIFLLYYVGNLFFSKNVGIIAAFLYATSPQMIVSSRMPYHTSPIPFFTLLFILSLYSWIKGNKYAFPVCILLLAVLYNFELATATLGIIFIMIILFGFWKRFSWVTSLRDSRIIILSVFAYVIPMLPMILYDIHHGYPQTLKFVAWLGYHILLLFGFPSIHPNLTPMNWNTVFSFAAQNYQLLIFTSSGIVAFFIALITFGVFYYRFYQTLRYKTYHLGMILVGFITALLLVGFLANRTTSSAYLPDLFPMVILLIAAASELPKKKYFKVTVIIILIVGILNVYTLLRTNYFVIDSYADMVYASKLIIKEAHGQAYTIKGYGVDGTVSNFTSPFVYLTWWLGNGPSDKPEKLVFYIKENERGIQVIKTVNGLTR